LRHKKSFQQKGAAAVLTDLALTSAILAIKMNLPDLER
jgi:hypothetical protein